MAKHWPYEAGMVSERSVRGTHMQPSRMAPADDKSKVDEHLPKRGIPAANKRSIDENQREGSVIAKGIKGAGAVKGSKRTPTKNAINQDQGPKFPAGATVKKRRPWKSSRGAKIRPSGPLYGGPNGRP